MTLALVEWGLIGEVVLVSFVAGVAATALFATVILGSTRAADVRRAGRGGAVAYTLLAVAALLAFLAVVVFAILVMVDKG